MSCQITLNTWSGESKTEAAERLSRIFRLNKEKGLTTVEDLCKGLPWRFENTISDKQASQAAKFLPGSRVPAGFPSKGTSIINTQYEINKHIPLYNMSLIHI